MYLKINYYWQRFGEVEAYINKATALIFLSLFLVVNIWEDCRKETRNKEKWENIEDE